MGASPVPVGSSRGPSEGGARLAECSRASRIHLSTNLPRPIMLPCGMPQLPLAMTVDAAGLPVGKLPPPRSTEFLWVDNHRETREKSSGKATFRSKQAWLRAKSHRLRKQTGLQRLKTSIAPFPTTGGASACKPSYTNPQSTSDAHSLILYPSLNVSILECLPSLSLHINFDVRLYLHHCEYLAPAACKSPNSARF